MKNSKIKSLVLIDIALIPIFIGVIITGFGLHDVVHHQASTNLMWKPLHILFAALSLIVSIVHIHQHWGWYRGIINGTKTKKCRVTTALTVLFILTTLSGLLIYIIPTVGVKHYILGLALMLLAFLHIAKRFKWLIKNCTK